MWTKVLLSGASVLSIAVAGSFLVGFSNASHGDPVVVAAGDIACGTSELSAAGASSCRSGATSELLVGKRFAKVLALGDEQYPCGSLTDFERVYGPSWGRVKVLTRPAPGNHEYETTGSGCDASGQAHGYFSYFGKSAGSPDRGYYSFDVRAWHLVALNSNCTAVGGCDRGSAQELWLRHDLAAHRRTCTLAYWHHPRFSSGANGNELQTSAFWRDLYAAHADVVLNGHDHDYERFARQDPQGRADRRGIREFVVGTGGKSHFPFVTTQRNSQLRNADTFGVLELTLHRKSYAWRFVPERGATFSDSGTARCRA
jgi:acid phosphatase type 7